VGNTSDLSMLRNDVLRFHRRLYTAFDADLRRLRLQLPLSELTTSCAPHSRPPLAQRLMCSRHAQ
jgi:hypothetical protein